MLSKIIEKNSSVPTRQKQIFTTSKDNQSTITMNIYQGEKPIASDNTYLSTIKLRNIPPCPRGVPQIEVTFTVDENMIVNVTAKDKGTGREQHIIATSPYSLNNAQIRIMKERLGLWASERRIQEIKRLIEPLKSSICDMLEKNISILNWDNISTLKKTIALLDNLLNAKASPDELKNSISSVQAAYDEIKLNAVKFNDLIEEVGELGTKIDRLIFMLKSTNAKEANLLAQGKILLYDTVNKKPSYEELQSIFLSVQLEYVNTKSNLIKILLENLRTSTQMREWLAKAYDGLSDLYTLSQYLLRLRGFKEVKVAITILESESPKYQKLIQKRILKKVKEESDPLIRFIILLAFESFFTELDIEEMLSDDKIGDYIALPLFNELHKDKPITQRVLAAKIITERLPAVSQYLPIIIDCLYAESDETVKEYLVSYLDKQPSGNFYKFFRNADLKTKEKIVSSKEVLIKLAKEPHDEAHILVIEALLKFPETLLKFPIEEIIQILLSFINNKNFVIRTRILELIQSRGIQMSKVIKEALRHTSPEIRLFALKYIRQSKEAHYLPNLIALLKTENDEVIMKKAVIVLSVLKGVNTLPFVFGLLLESDTKAYSRIASCLKLNNEIMEEDIKKLFNLIIKVREEKQRLGAKDKIFLWHFAKKHTEMKQVVEDLEKIKNKGGK